MRADPSAKERPRSTSFATASRGRRACSSPTTAASTCRASTTLRAKMRAAGRGRVRVPRREEHDAAARRRRLARRRSIGALQGPDRDRVLVRRSGRAREDAGRLRQGQRAVQAARRRSLEGQALGTAEIATLATLPSLDELRGKLIGLLQAPATPARAPAGRRRARRSRASSARVASSSRTAAVTSSAIRDRRPDAGESTVASEASHQTPRSIESQGECEEHGRSQHNRRSALEPDRHAGGRAREAARREVGRVGGRAGRRRGGRGGRRGRAGRGEDRVRRHPHLARATRRSRSSRRSAPSRASASRRPRTSSRARRSRSRKASPRTRPTRSRSRSRPPAARSTIK